MKLAAATIASLALACSASARDDEAATFAYNPAHSAEQVVAAFERAALTRCREVLGFHQRAVLGLNPRALRACQRELVAEAAAATGRSDVMALLESEPAERRFALSSS